MVADERLQLGHELGVPAEGEVGLAAQLERVQPELLEAPRLGLGEGLGDHVGQRRAAPERQRLAQEPRGGRRRGVLGLGHERLEAAQVEVVAAEPEDVARLLRLDRVRRRERLAQLRDVVLQRVRRVGRRCGAPQLVDQAVDRDDLVGARDQEREERPLPRSADADRTAPVDDLQGSEDAELHGLARRR